MASLCVTEVLSEAKDRKQTVYIASLDAQKAFDVVSHEILINKMMAADLNRGAISLIKNLYENAHECVKWKGKLSSAFEIKQGVRQGAILSTNLYKLYVDDLLTTLSARGLGVHIGHIYMGCVACADDIILLAHTELDLQEMLDIAYRYAQVHRYLLHPQKSVQLVTNPKESVRVKLGDNILPSKDTLEHLGILREVQRPNNTQVETDNRIRLQRRATYSLMKVGVHGEGGLHPAAAAHLINTYVLPKVTYGLDTLIQTETEYKSLDSAQCQLLRDIQSLPKRTAREAVYLLLGAVPIRAHLALAKLTLFGAIIHQPESSPLHLLATRQLSRSGTVPSSWFSHVKSLAAQYDIHLQEVLEHPWSKGGWKSRLYNVIPSQEFIQLLKLAKEKSSLKYLDTMVLRPGLLHPIWKYTGNSPSQLVKAAYRAKLLVGTYILQANRSKFNQHQIDATCPLCRLASEDTIHFLLRCGALANVRQKLLVQTTQLLVSHDIRIPTSDLEWTKTILNGIPPDVKYSVKGSHIILASCTTEVSQKVLSNLAEIFNNLCHNLHQKRSQLLARLSTRPEAPATVPAANRGNQPN